MKHSKNPSFTRIPGRISRRRFNKNAALAASALFAAPSILRGQNLNNVVNIAVVGAGGRGAANANECRYENIVALCDVDKKRLEQQQAKYKDSKGYADYRELFDKEKSIDAVIVATPEHSHAIPVLLAIQANKHVYCEKPLSHDIYEARLIREAAAKKPNLATQMGNQNHASDNTRAVVEMIRSGVIGGVREVHVWVNRAWGLQSKEASDRNKDIVYVTERPAPQQPPEYLDWDKFVGPAPYRPFTEAYWPGPRWYRWWDFGNGTMSDLGSHMNDLPFWALNLKAPRTVRAESDTPPHPEIAPASMSAIYEYDARGDMPACTFSWHQGDNKAPQIKNGEITQQGDGHIWIGDKGIMVSNHRSWRLLPEEKFKDYKAPAPTLPRGKNNWQEWLSAIKEGKPQNSLGNFNYSGWLTEANHLGNVAYRVGKTLQWDQATMKARNAPEADKYIRCPYRDGYTLPTV